MFRFSLFALFTLMLMKPAYAYIDPGTGSLILQILLGGVAGILSFLKIYWYQVKSFFQRFKSQKAGSED